MTTRKELGEILIESERTGREIQERTIGSGTWCEHRYNSYNIAAYEYRLAPSVVKHERWVILHDNLGYPTETEAEFKAGEREVMKITWETEE